MEKGFMHDVMCKPAAGAELAKTAAAPKTPHIRAIRQQTCTTGSPPQTSLYFLNCMSPAVAHNTSYCWGPVYEEVGICGGEQSSARLISETQIAEFWCYSFGSLNSAPTTGLHMTACITPFSMVPSTDAAVYVVRTKPERCSRRKEHRVQGFDILYIDNHPQGGGFLGVRVCTA